MMEQDIEKFVIKNCPDSQKVKPNVHMILELAKKGDVNIVVENGKVTRIPNINFTKDGTLIHVVKKEASPKKSSEVVNIKQTNIMKKLFSIQQ